TLYLDIFSGISGDMFMGALLDLGVDAQRLESELAKLGLDDYHLHISRGRKSSIEGVKFDVHLDPEHAHHHPDPVGEHHIHAHSLPEDDHTHDALGVHGGPLVKTS